MTASRAPLRVKRAPHGARPHRLGHSGRLPRLKQLLEPPQRRRQRAVVIGADRDKEIVGARVSHGLEPEGGQQVEVQRGGHRDQGCVDSRQPGDGVRHVHQGDGVAVKAAPHVDDSGHDAFRRAVNILARANEARVPAL